MAGESRQIRAAWTAAIEGGQAPKANKYGAVRTGKYASKHEADVAAKLFALERAGEIKNLREQVSYTLVEGQGKIRPIRYIADFTYDDVDGVQHICDAKGFSKNPVWRLKRKLMALLHGLTIEEL